MGENSTATIEGNATGEGLEQSAVNTNGAGNQEGQSNGDVKNTATEGQNTAQNEKMYSAKELQAETDRRVAEAIKTAQAKWNKNYAEKLENEKAEAVRLAKMSAEERAQAEFEKRVQEFDKQKKQYESEKLVFECGKTLAAEGLPIEFADILAGANADETSERVGAFKKAFQAAIEAAVTDRLKGESPRGKQREQNQEPEDAFLKGFGV